MIAVSMQRSTPLAVAGFLIIISSCLALAATLPMALFTWSEYFVPSHLGSVRWITEVFYIVTSIIIFEISAFVLGLNSAFNIFKAKKFGLAILGVTFLIIAGLLFFTNIPLNAIPQVESFFGSYSVNLGLLPIYQLFCGLPMIILASIGTILLVLKRIKFDNKEINPSIALKALLVLCSVTTAFFVIVSSVPYEQSMGEFASNYPLANMIVNTFVFIFSTLTGLLLFNKRYVHTSVALIILSLITAISLPFIFVAIYPWIGSFVKGFVTESPIIILLAVALALALLGQRNRNQVTAKSIDT
jgi:hypothetical protein